MEDDLQKMEDNLKKKIKNGRRPQKKIKNQINLTGCDTIVN